MDFLSSSQLRTYDSIIDKIQSEHEKSTKLKQEIERENNKIIISHLSKSNLPQKIAHVNVKIFSDVVELFYLYRDEINSDVSSFFKDENCKFYLVEILISNSFQTKLKGIDWSLIISIRNDCVYLCKKIQVKNCEGPIREVLPIDENIVDCEVSIALIMPTEENCFSIPLGTVLIDISYHFEMNKKLKCLNKPRTILQLTRNYNTSFDSLEIRKTLWIEYQFLTKIDSKDFVRKFIRNCYHKMDLECFSELGNSSKNNFVLKFSTGLEKHSITFDRVSSLIMLKSNVADLVRLKNYFCQEGFMEVDHGDNLKKDLKELLASAGRCEEKEDLFSFYMKLRRFWTTSHI